MKRGTQGVLIGVVLPVTGLIPWPPMPWQIGRALDNALYQIEWSIAFYAWQPHTTMMAIANVFSRVSDVLSTSILPAVATQVIAYVESSNLFGIAVGFALILAALSLLGSFLDLSIVDLKQVVKYSILISLVLTYGASAMTSVESFRGRVASALYEQAYSAIDSGGGMGGVFAAPSPTEPWAHFNLEDKAPPHGRISSYDAALSALGASASEAMMPSLPASFEAMFFPHDSITSLSDSQRSDAIQRGWQGIVRLFLSGPLSWASVVESAMEVLFSIGGMILLVSMPFVLVFGLFRPTQAIVGQLLQQYLMLFVNYVVASMLIAVGVSGLVTAATTHSLTMMVAASLLANIFYYFGTKSAWNAAKSSFTAATGSVAQAIGVEEPIGKAVDTAKSAAGITMGLGGAAIATAAGVPHLAPVVLKAGQSFSDLSKDEQKTERRKGMVRTGLGIAGGMAMQGTPLQGPATAVAAMGTFGGEDGVGEMMAGLQGADATMVGLSSRSPFGAVYALDRARRRRERIERKYGSSQQEGERDDTQDSTDLQGDHRQRSGRDGIRRHSIGRAHGSGQAQAPTAANASVGATIRLFKPDQDSPWKQEIEQGIAQFGQEWANEVADAVRELAEDLRSEGQDEKAVASHFVDDQGRPSFNSDLGRQIFDNLDEETRRLLVTETAARKAAVGVISEEVMPERTITREDLAGAVAYAVDHAGGAKGAGAQAVAESLNLDVEQLGASFGAYNSLVVTARKAGHSGGDVRQQILDPEGDYLAASAKKLANFMPSSITFKETQLR